MKRILSIITVVAVLMVGLCCASAEQATISQQNAIYLAGKALRELDTSITDEDFATLNARVDQVTLEGHSGQVLYVVFSIALDRLESYIGSITMEPYTGGILSTDVTVGAIDNARRYNEGIHVREAWEKEKGPEYLWPYEDVVEFYQLYSDGEYRLPGEGDLSLDEAVAIARKYAMDTWQLTAEYLDPLPVQAQLQKDGTLWYVYFVDESLRNVDGYLVPHMVVIANPSGTIEGGMMGDVNSRG